MGSAFAPPAPGHDPLETMTEPDYRQLCIKLLIAEDLDAVRRALEQLDA